jgi:hypothetical protein
VGPFLKTQVVKRGVQILRAVINKKAKKHRFYGAFGIFKRRV